MIKKALKKGLKKAKPKNIYEIVQEQLARPEDELTATQLLHRIARAGGLSSPHYEYEARGTPSEPAHWYKVRFRIPESIFQKTRPAFYDNPILTGHGQFGTKSVAKDWAANEVVQRLEKGLKIKPRTLQTWLERYEQEQQAKEEARRAVPVEQEIPGVSWTNLPIDLSFKETEPATRRGYIEFSPELVQNHKASAAAKALTLTANQSLPTVLHRANPTESGKKQLVRNLLLGRLSPSTALRNSAASTFS